MPELNPVAPPATTGVPSGTPGAEGLPPRGSTPAPAGTSPQGGVDVEKMQRELEEARQSLNVAREKSERDISNLKSSLQKDFAAAQQKWDAERREWQTRFDAVQTADMDEATKANYERDRERERYGELETRFGDLQRQLEEAQAMQGYSAWFTRMGVPPKDLVLNQGIEGLLASGWSYLEDELGRLRNPAPAPAPVAPPPQPPVAPNVLSGVSGSPMSAPTIEKLVKDASDRLGRPVTEEEFWRMVDNQQLRLDMNSVAEAMTRS